MVKRGNDSSQVSKEEYEAEETSESTPTGSWQKADAKVMSGRKIIRASRTSLESSTTTTPSTDNVAKPNPFASISFAAPAAKAVSFAAPNSPHQPTMEAGKQLKKTPAPESFIKHSHDTMKQPATSFIGIPTPAKPTTTSGKEEQAEKVAELSQKFRQRILSLPVQGQEWTTVTGQYIELCNKLTREFAKAGAPTTTNGGGSFGITAAPPFAAANTTSPTATVVTASTTSTTPAHSIGTLTPTSAVAIKSLSETPAADSTSTSATETNPSFSGTTTSNKNNNKNTTTSNNKYYETRGRYLYYKDGNWKFTSTGTLALEHDDAGKRIVIRDALSFKPMFTCVLPKECTIEQAKTSKGIHKKFIQFLTKLKDAQDVTLVRLQVATPETDKLYEKIRELGDL